MGKCLDHEFGEYFNFKVWKLDNIEIHYFIPNYNNLKKIKLI